MPTLDRNFIYTAQENLKHTLPFIVKIQPSLAKAIIAKGLVNEHARYYSLSGRHNRIVSPVGSANAYSIH